MENKPNPLLRNIKICWIQGKIHPAEQFIIDLLEKSTTKSGDLHKVWFNQENEWIIEYDIENDWFWLHYDRIWVFFESKYKLGRQQIKDITKILLERHLKCKVATTNTLHNFIEDWRDT